MARLCLKNLTPVFLLTSSSATTKSTTTWSVDRLRRGRCADHVVVDLGVTGLGVMG
ncbi:MAG: hypothetical protein IJ635_03090 [Bacteroidaceae bacterium]|nr:hypothetical protein [Bacteroidaceae bacterium]